MVYGSFYILLVPFANMLLKGFACIFIKDIGSDFFGASLSSFGIRVMVLSENEFGECLLQFFGEVERTNDSFPLYVW